MSFSDTLINCVQCHKTFTFTVAEREYKISRGYPNNPARCPSCLRARKNFRPPEENGVGIKVRSSNYLR